MKNLFETERRIQTKRFTQAYLLPHVEMKELMIRNDFLLLDFVNADLCMTIQL